MKLELTVMAATYAFYMTFEQGSFKSSWRVNLFAILVPIFILKYVKDLDLKVRIFITAILALHVIDVLNNAIDTGLKNNEDYKCTYTASTSTNEMIEEEVLKPSSPERDLMSSSSQQQTDA
jgi:hypothetical protein